MKTLSDYEYFEVLESNAHKMVDITLNRDLTEGEKELHRSELRVSMFLGTQYQPMSIDDYIFELIKNIQWR